MPKRHPASNQASEASTPTAVGVQVKRAGRGVYTRLGQLERALYERLEREAREEASTSAEEGS